MKPRGRTTTSAKVTVTLELSNLGSWGPNCTTGQVHDQASEAALGRLNRLFKEHLDSTKIVGRIKVEAISTDLERT
jgi:hypothetical protein